MIDKNRNNVIEFDVGVNKLLNIAYKKIDKSDYLNAIPILKKALKEDDKNVDVLLELALVYSKMNMLDVSNRYAYSALALEHNETSLYILGNNFLKMHNYEKGINYYKRLVDMYPNGEHSDYAAMVIERLDDKEITKRELKLLKLTKKGKEYIEQERYKSAIRLFSLLSTVEPEQVFLKNNLAMAYFYDKKPEKAIKQCKDILAMRRYDVYANCNLALFYYKQKDKHEYNKQKERLKRLKPVNYEEFVKLLSTYCEMKCHEDIIRVAKQAILTYSYDITCMFFLAAANYNLGKVNNALSVYHDILKIDEDNYVAYYYIKSIKSIMKPKKVDYYNQLPIVAVIDGVKRLKVLSEMSKEELADSWNVEDRLLVIWGTRHKDEGIKRLCFNILGTLGNAESESDLREALFSISISDEVKKDVLAALRLMDAEQPYAAYFADDILDVKVSVATIENSKELERPQKAMDIFKDAAPQDFDEDLLKECVDMYVMVLNSGWDKKFRSLNALCAMIEISVREIYKMDYDRKEIIKRYKTTDATVDSYGVILAEMFLSIKERIMATKEPDKED